MICPNCGTFIDLGEPCCPYCLWNLNEDDGKMDPISDKLDREERTCIECGRPFRYDSELMREKNYCQECLNQSLEPCLYMVKNSGTASLKAQYTQNARKNILI